MADFKYLVDEVILELGSEIIELAMRDKLNQRFTPSVEAMVESIIYKTSFRDLNLIGGVEIQINTKYCNITSSNEEGVFIEIPEEELHSRSIVSVLGVISNQAPHQSTALERANSKDLPTPEGSTKIDIVGHNTLFVYTDTVGYMNALKLYPHTISLIVSYSERLNEIGPTSLPLLSEFVVLGVKRYLYSQLRMSHSISHIYHGHELPIIQSYLEEFRDASSRYKEMRKSNIKALLFANDTITMSNYIDSLI